MSPRRSRHLAPCGPLLGLTLLLAGESLAQGAAERPRDAAFATGAPSTEWLVQTQWIMGTALRIAVADPASGGAENLTFLFDDARRWNDLLSNYDPSSPLSRINAHAGRQVPIPCELAAYLERAVADGRRTDGAFDLTVGSRSAPSRPTGGSAKEVASAPPMDLRLLEIDRGPEGCWARLPIPGMALDPGGDGKGVALDHLRELLQGRGVRSAFLDFGGSSMLALGHPPEGEHWRVELPGLDGRPWATAHLVDRALSVSASFRRDHAPVCGDDSGAAHADLHIVDPRTGEWIRMPRIAIVISPSATDAEVLSTALVVEGAAGMRWVRRFAQAEAVLLQEGEAPVSSAGLSRWLVLYERID